MVNEIKIEIRSSVRQAYVTKTPDGAYEIYLKSGQCRGRAEHLEGLASLREFIVAGYARMGIELQIEEGTR